MKYYIVAGEASGDLHGANLIKALKRKDPAASFRCWGGDHMAATGVPIVKHIRDLAFMGFVEVVKHLPTILGNLRFCKEDISAFEPDVVILIDYPGFNFRLLRYLHEKGIRIFYYISPQLWAWNTSRVHQVKKYVEHMFVIFPFEKDFYKKYGIEAHFIGHPLLDELPVSTGADSDTRSNVIALLPGSRKHEVAYLLPHYLKVVEEFPEYKFVVTGMKGIGREFYQSIMGNSKAELVMDSTYEVLQTAKAAIVTSGTATLETALHRVPQVVCYKGSWISYFIIWALINRSIGFICIVNLICGKKVVTELIQADVNKERLIEELRYLLSGDGRLAIAHDYALLRSKLGESGASDRAAELMVGYLKA